MRRVKQPRTRRAKGQGQRPISLYLQHENSTQTPYPDYLSRRSFFCSACKGRCLTATTAAVKQCPSLALTNHAETQRPLTTTETYTAFLPLIQRNFPILAEFRGLWVTRFDWTRFGYTVTQSDLDAIVDRAAAAHFNALLFQVRGTADAYYSSTLEPWAARLTGSTTKTLGTNPGFDPLAYLITRAHQSGLQVHAYINIFPTWLCGVGAPPASTTPQHLFWTLSHSTTWSAWRVHDQSGSPQNIATCADYLWATPALSLTRNHITAVAADIVQRYDVDGLHLDLIRYPGSTYSFDPYTMQAFSDALQISPTLTITAWRPQFQRAQINTIVAADLLGHHGPQTRSARQRRCVAQLRQRLQLVLSGFQRLAGRWRHRRQPADALFQRHLI